MEINRSNDGGCCGNINYHSNIFVTVRRISPELLLAQSVLLSTGCEATASITANTADFLIQEASWEIYRSSGSGEGGGRTVTELTGVEAYFDADQALRAVGEKDGDIPRVLLTECVKGIIQAETYLFQDKGFPTAEIFEATSMNKSYAGSCRLYSNMERVTQTWYQYIADRKCGDALFNLCKTAVVRMAENGIFIAEGGFIDSFQELSVRLTVADGVVSDLNGEFLRAPDQICLGNMALLNSLMGQNIANLTERQVETYCGGSQGCSHIVDIVNHIINALQQTSPKQYLKF